MTDPLPQPDLWSILLSPDARNAMSGAAGGVVRWITLRETMRAGAVSILVGSICAIYLGPLVAPLIEPVIGKLAPDGDAKGFAAFVVGLGGITMSGLLIDIIRARRGSLREAPNDRPENPPPSVESVSQSVAPALVPVQVERAAFDGTRAPTLGDPEV